MSCANPTARSCSRSCARAANARRGSSYPRDLILYMRTKDGLKNQVGNKNPFASSVLGPQYVRAADGSYTNAGAVAPVDVIDGRKMLRTCGAVTNMLTNSVFAGAVSGTPGTAPMGWTSAGNFTVDGESITFSSVAAMSYVQQAFSVDAQANVCVAQCVCDGVLAVQHLLNAVGTGQTKAWYVDGEPVVQAFVPTAGAHEIEFVTTVSAPTSLSIRFGSAVISNQTGTVTMTRPMVSNVRNAPYVPTTTSGPVTQPASNATTTNGCWFTLADGSPVWKALTGEPLTLATRVRMGVGSGDLPLSSFNNHVIQCLDGNTPRISAFEKGATGNSNPSVANDGTTPTSAGLSEYPRNAIIRRVTQVDTAGTQFRVGYMIEGTHTAIQWSSWAAFDGSFNPSTLYKLMLGFNNTYPMHFDTIALWNTQADDATILKWVKS